MSGTFRLYDDVLDDSTVWIDNISTDDCTYALNIAFDCSPHLTLDSAVNAFTLSYLTPLGITPVNYYYNEPDTLSMRFSFEPLSPPKLVVSFFAISTHERIIDVARVFLSVVGDGLLAESYVSYVCSAASLSSTASKRLRLASDRESVVRDPLTNYITIWFDKITDVSLDNHRRILETFMLTRYNTVIRAESKYTSTYFDGDYFVYRTRVVSSIDAASTFDLIIKSGWIDDSGAGMYHPYDLLKDDIFPSLML